MRIGRSDVDERRCPPILTGTLIGTSSRTNPEAAVVSIDALGASTSASA